MALHGLEDLGLGYCIYGTKQNLGRLHYQIANLRGKSAPRRRALQDDSEWFRTSVIEDMESLMLENVLEVEGCICFLSGEFVRRPLGSGRKRRRVRRDTSLERQQRRDVC